jgi:hypothetical protein
MRKESKMAQFSPVFRITTYHTKMWGTEADAAFLENLWNAEEPSPQRSFYYILKKTRILQR